MSTRLRRLSLLVALAGALSLLVSSAPLLAQEGRADYLIRLLRTSSAFRVRAQAAISLGSIPASPEIVSALTDALRDSEPAVRAAAASALERLGDPSVLGALRALSRDPEDAVRQAAARAVTALEQVARGGSGGSGSSGGSSGSTGGSSTGSGTARYYVGIGLPGSRVDDVDPEVLASARTFIRQRVQQLDGVVIAPDSETPNQAQQVLRQRSLSGFFLDSSIVALEERDDGAIRAQVSVIVQTYPDRNVRSMLNGAATVRGDGDELERAAIEGALTGALRNLQQALSAGSPR